jgi:hypothetical protein
VGRESEVLAGHRERSPAPLAFSASGVVQKARSAFCDDEGASLPQTTSREQGVGGERACERTETTLLAPNRSPSTVARECSPQPVAGFEPGSEASKASGTTVVRIRASVRRRFRPTVSVYSGEATPWLSIHRSLRHRQHRVPVPNRLRFGSRHAVDGTHW